MNDNLYRTMALDYGEVRIGIAISDLMGIVANGVETYTRTKNVDIDIEHIAKLIAERNVKLLVVGLPLNMDGSEGERVQATKAFVDKLLERVNIKVDYIDERLTSVSAEDILLSADVSRSKRKKVIDKLAATIILQNYLDSNKRR